MADTTKVIRPPFYIGDYFPIDTSILKTLEFSADDKPTPIPEVPWNT